MIKRLLSYSLFTLNRNEDMTLAELNKKVIAAVSTQLKDIPAADVPEFIDSVKIKKVDSSTGEK
jgi:hypothetical protein